jgi:hypothetical protein
MVAMLVILMILTFLTIDHLVARAELRRHRRNPGTAMENQPVDG